MFLLKALNFARRAPRVIPEPPCPAERRVETRQAMFQEAVLALEDYYKIRAIITDLSESGARIQFASRVDLPFRVRISASTLKVTRWARVVWQAEGAAGLQFLNDEADPLF